MQPWTAEPREALTEAAVRATLTIDRRIKVRHGVDVLDSSDDESGETFDVEGAGVTWSYRPPDSISGGSTKVAEVRRRATLTIVGLPTVPLVLRRYRLWTEWLSPTGSWTRFWLGVFVPTIPPLDDDGIVVRSEVKLADKTYRYSTTTLTDTLTIPPATNVVDWVIDHLESFFGETVFAIPASTETLATAKTFPSGTSWLEVYNSLLEVAGYDQLISDESGRPAAVPKDDIAGRGSEITYGPGASKIVTAAGIEPLLPTLPNEVRFVARAGPSLATEGNGIRTVTNQSTGPASIDESGETRSITVDVDAENQTQLDVIAAADAQRYFAGGGLRFTGHVALNPRHSDRDVITLDKPRLGLDGVWNVTEWTYPMKPVDGESSVLMPITCERRV